MSNIRNSAFALAATVALGAGAVAAATPAEASTGCYNIYCSMSNAKKISHPVTYGARGSQVVYLQKALRGASIRVAVTGKFDYQTLKALRTYQASRHVSHTAARVADKRVLGYLRVGAGPHRTVRATTMMSSSASSQGQAAVNFAYAQLGKPYVYGATGPSAYDCSGLTSAAWRAAGVSVPRTSYAQAGLPSVSRSNLQPGDIVIFYGGGHVGIYIGNGKVIHAPHTGDVVRIAPLSSMPFVKAVRPA